ncbi:hypothetical protein JDV02_001316 [Purpureocillium takamizusanense]|uniref:Uncharacterized protein n=1 Tax=Purpureocillium takamizusanense TaxID=2060973 RepID=A0A9Q8Q7W8_9HYPO|nr:uncharacterized protein JDV02_001316 [Purpureocillium takamizusanense]UNI14715.1 hypothetical protein JDV02_001316 [Purpureocillium takamizusanense]
MTKGTFCSLLSKRSLAASFCHYVKKYSHCLIPNHLDDLVEDERIQQLLIRTCYCCCLLPSMAIPEADTSARNRCQLSISGSVPCSEMI